MKALIDQAKEQAKEHGPLAQLLAVLTLVVILGYQQTLGQSSASSNGPSVDRLEERIEGRNAAIDAKFDGRHTLVMARLDDVVKGQTTQVSAIVDIAKGVGAIEAAVDALVLNQTAMQAQMAARVEADRKQDEAIASMRRSIDELQRLMEKRP